MFKFEELRVYQDTLNLIDIVYEETKKWPREEQFGLTDQFRRAVVSIGLNVAEGTSRTSKDFRHFLDVARGSCYECVAILAIAKRRKYIHEHYGSLYEQLDKVSRMISALKNSLH